MVVVAVGVQSSTAMAASLTSLSDTMTRLQASTASNHDIRFVTPSGGGVASTETVELTFSADFTPGSVAFGDIDFQEGDSNNCSTAGWTDETLVAAGPSSSQFSAAFAGNVLTFTSGGASATIAADRCIRVLIGTNAAGGSNQITNGAIDDDDSIAIAGTFGDTGTIAVDIITDDTVDISATVSPSITFTINDVAIGFGTLSFSAATWANAGATGSATDTSAHNLTVATNATSGYALTYNGATLTSGGNTIDAATISNDADGTAGTEQFAIGFDVDNSSTIASGYDHNVTPGNRDWNFVPSTTTTVVSRTTPTNTETINAYYLANISATGTAAGVYNTSVTYTATATF